MIVLVQSTITSCGMDDNHRGVCFLKDEKIRVYGVAGHPYNYMDISNFPAVTLIHVEGINGTLSV